LWFCFSSEISKSSTHTPPQKEENRFSPLRGN
jgi:hypothetical protein